MGNMAFFDFVRRGRWRLCIVAVLAAGIAGLAGVLIGNRLIPALLQLGVQG
jgi:hypothetical protein